MLNFVPSQRNDLSGHREKLKCRALCGPTLPVGRYSRRAAMLEIIMSNPHTRRDQLRAREKEEKRQFYKTWRRLLSSGKVQRPAKCSECDYSSEGGGKASIQGHHEDYNNPEVVIWLCPNCHMSRHRQMRETEKTDTKGWDDKRVNEIAEILGLKTW